MGPIIRYLNIISYDRLQDPERQTMQKQESLSKLIQSV